MSFKIVVMSCDKNMDLFPLFHHCMEKYWKDHPDIIYSTETIENPYYKTICCNYPLEKWTKRVYDTIKDFECDNILLMTDDLFIREPVNNQSIKEIENYIGGIIAAFNLEKPFDQKDIPLNDIVCLRNPNGKYKTSVMCQMWNKNALLDLFSCEQNPWEFEENNNSKHYLFLIRRNKCYINWGYQYGGWFGIRKGKWCKECKTFFDNEEIEIDYSIRGFYE